MYSSGSPPTGTEESRPTETGTETDFSLTSRLRHEIRLERSVLLGLGSLCSKDWLRKQRTIRHRCVGSGASLFIRGSQT